MIPGITGEAEILVDVSSVTLSPTPHLTNTFKGLHLNCWFGLSFGYKPFPLLLSPSTLVYGGRRSGHVGAARGQEVAAGAIRTELSRAGFVSSRSKQI